MADMKIAENVEPLKKPEIERDSIGRFERKGKLARAAKVKNKITGDIRPNNLPARGPGRPPGSPNKVTAALKDMILQSLDEMGGVEYLKQLAVDNSSAYAGLISKVLPSTIHGSESDGGIGVKMTFERVLVWPDGHREVEGVTPKSLPAPDASDALPRPTDPTDDTNEGAA
jgi:hypothetical protein